MLSSSALSEKRYNFLSMKEKYENYEREEFSLNNDFIMCDWREIYVNVTVG